MMGGRSPAEIQVGQGQLGQLKNLVLKKADRTVRGLVEDAEGKPVPGAVVGASVPGGSDPLGFAVTDSQGRFVLEQLSEQSEIRIAVHVPGRGWIANQTITPKDNDVTLHAAPSHWD